MGENGNHICLSPVVYIWTSFINKAKIKSAFNNMPHLTPIGKFPIAEI